MDDQNKNLILATALSLVVLIGWFALFPPPVPTVTDPNAEPTALETPVPSATDLSSPKLADDTEATEKNTEAGRVIINSDRLTGSISLQGGKIDEIFLKEYQVALIEGAPNVKVLKPKNEIGSYYAQFEWMARKGIESEGVPNRDTVWTVDSGDVLTTSSPVTLSWDNGTGQIFRQVFSIDKNFMFSVEQSVENSTYQTISLTQYGRIARHGKPDDLKNFFILHEGAMRKSEKERLDYTYNSGFFNDNSFEDFEKDPDWGDHADALKIENNGWIGFTDHYWMVMLIPDKTTSFTGVLRHNRPKDIYDAFAYIPSIEIQANSTQAIKTDLFVGAKEWNTIKEYQNNGVEDFLDSIDWGLFFFLTKPIFSVLFLINSLINNMGWSIIVLTLLIKAVLFPLAYKSYVSMAKMKELQPEMEKIKERTGDDRQKLQQEMMALYKKEKVNPASGCLPILLQIPIFFSLYKVIFVTLELRHAPWIGWITDLSAPDPSSILNLFGLLPYAVPELGMLSIISLGILPILLGISMWVQQKLNPAPTDPTQAMIFAWMPWVFMFMLGTFASGLVVYWIANNTITFTQQYLIMRSQGYKPDVFGNMFSGFKKKITPDKK
ncbi:membrane protein insertase YidC [Paracoccaceae bacterium]|nr:membrane protein insertase YidC [Paracoccaceae bacterium]